jgi:hypothetical protein
MPALSKAEQWEFTRHFLHKGVEVVCGWVSGIKPAPAPAVTSVAAIRANTALLDVAVAFPQLKERRHDADYNHLATFTRAEALSWVDAAKDAIQKLDSQCGTPDYVRFMALFLLKTAPRQN